MKPPLKPPRRTRLRVRWFAAWLLAGALAPSVFAIAIRDDTYGFSLEIPDQFREASDLSQNPKNLYVFLHTSPSGQRTTVILIDRMMGLIGPEPLSTEIPSRFLESDPSLSVVGITRTNWKGFELEGLSLRRLLEGRWMVSHAAQVPLRREAIQITVMGPEDSTAATEDLLRRIVGGLEGESNWENGPGEPLTMRRRISSLISGTVVLLLTVAAVFGLVRWIGSSIRKGES